MRVGANLLLIGGFDVLRYLAHIQSKRQRQAWPNKLLKGMQVSEIGWLTIVCA